MNPKIEVIAITGINGLLGSNVARAALNKGYHVKGLIRKNSNLKSIKELNIELVEGDILDKSSLQKLIQGADAVIHVAGLPSLFQGDKEKLWNINVEGTKNIISLSLKYKIKRLIYTSSSAAIGHSPSPWVALTEDWVWNYPQRFIYHYTKWKAEELVLSANNPPYFETISLNPTIVFGPGDVNLSTGRIFTSIRETSLIPYTNGGVGICNAEEVGKAHVTALIKGRPGHRYILNCANLTLKRFFELILEVTEHKAQLLYLPPALFKIIGYSLTKVESYIFKRPTITGNLLESACLWGYYNSQKAIKELEYKPQLPIVSISSGYKWLKENKII